MSSVFKALQQVELERKGTASFGNQPFRPLDLLSESVRLTDDGPPQFVSLLPSLSIENRIVAMGDNCVGSEKFRVLSIRLRHLQGERRLKKVVITSSGNGEGKSLIAANLAATLARSQRVLLLEGDLRCPALSRLFGLAELKGLTDYLIGASPIGEVIYRLEPSQLHLLPAGTTTQDPVRLLESGRLEELMNDFGTSFDWIIIDSPPLVPLADATAWGRLADGLLLVVRGDKTPKIQLQKAAESVDAGRLLGVVLNAFPESTHEVQAQYCRPQSASDHA